MKALVSFLLMLGCCVLTKTAAAQITANFTASPLSGCAPLVVNFTNTSTGNPTAYYWDLGNGVTSVAVNPSTSYTQPGTYTITLTVSNASGSNTKTATNYITVHPLPSPNFTFSPTNGCPPLPVNFTNTSTSANPGPMTYTWNFGDGSPFVNTQHTSHIFTGPNSYNVVLTVVDGQGCSKPISKQVIVHPQPIISFSAPVNQCDAPALVNFTSNIFGNGPYIYQWNFGDGGVGTGAAPVHTYANPGAYTVTLTVTDANGCKDTLIKPNYINVGNLVPSFTVNAGCQGTALQFTNTSNLIDSVLWNFGDGTTDTAVHPAHVYLSSGAFNVKLYVYYGTCVDSVSQLVTVHPKPNAAYTFTPLHPCPVPVSLQFVNQSTGAATYFWDFADGGTSALSNPVHTYTWDDTALYPRLIAISNMGCPDTSYMEDTVALYHIMFNPGSPNAFHCLGDTARFRASVSTFDIFLITRPVIPYPDTIVSYYWDFGDGSSSTLDTPRHVYAARGLYWASLTAVTSNGCTLIDSFQIQVGHKPNASFTFSPDTVCNHGTITLVNTSTNAQWYVWDFGNGGSYTDTAGGIYTYTYQQSGIDTIILYAYDYGCADTFIANKPIVVRPPTALWTVKYDCLNRLSVQFYDTLSIEPTSHWWSFGDGDTTSATNPVHTYPSLGSYNVTLYTYNSIYGCTDTMTQTINLFDPVLSYTTTDTAICQGDSLTFTPSYTVSPVYDWNWYIDTALGYPYPLFPPSPFRTTGQWGYRFNQRGIYKIILLASDDVECVDTFRRTIVVAKPDAGFMASPQYACSPATISFTDTSKNVPGVFQTTRVWDFGNGVATSNTATVSNSYSVAGLYSVQLIVTDNVGCMDTLLVPNYIDIRDPVPGFTVNDSNACMKELIAFSNTTTGSNKFTSFWDFGDGVTDTAKNPVHAYHQTGSFTVKLVVTDSIGCKDSITKIAYIKISKPDAQFSLSDTMTICPPLNVLCFNTSTGAVSYAWNLGNGTSSGLQSPTASYTTPGVYQITLVAADMQNCKDTAYAQVRVWGYAGALTYTPLAGCAPLEVGFKAALYNVPSAIWDFSDGVTQLANGSDTTTHIYMSPGAYVPKLILSDNTGCQNSSIGLDTIKVDGVNAGFITSPPCINTPVTFTDTSFSYFSPLNDWRWSFNNGTYTTSNPVLQFSTAGSYPVTLAVTNANGCKDSVSTTFTIYDLPTIRAVADTSICAGDAAQLSATGGTLYEWAPSATLSCNSCQSPVATPPTPTTYIVTGTDNHGCRNKDTVNVKLQTVTTSDVGNGGEICQDSSFRLSAYGAHQYEWMPAEFLDNHLVPDPVATPPNTTLFTVIAKEGSCAPDTNTVRVIVHPRPNVDAGTDVTIIAGASTMLNATGSNLEDFLWSPAATLSCETCSNPTASPMVTTKYKVVATSDRGCRAYDTVTVHVICDNSQLFIPNTFSPNSDGQNDVFYPRGEGLDVIQSFRIYNRWGELMFERANMVLNDAAQGWDGSFKGNQLPPDTYVYVLNAICDNGDPISWKGDITLIR